MNRSAEEAAIARFIAERGVTMVSLAFCAPTMVAMRPDPATIDLRPEPAPKRGRPTAAMVAARKRGWFRLGWRRPQ